MVSGNVAKGKTNKGLSLIETKEAHLRRLLLMSLLFL
jgi:hypothetical protein